MELNKKLAENLYDVKGKVVLITGASGALGSALSYGFGYAGSKVMITGRKESIMKAQCENMKSKGIECSYFAADPAVEEDVKKLVEATVEGFGKIDVLITAAGFNAPKSIIEHTLEDWQKIIDVNVKGTWLCAKYVGEQMVKQGKGGKVILVSSARSKIGMKNYTGYCTAKGGIDLMAQSLACEWGEHSINVNTFNPTVFRSDLTEWMFEDDTAKTKFLTRIPIGRLGEPEDFVGTAIFLASKASDFITGANIAVDGGYWAN
jgi:NAD(P)-dependent dehydrogenase (short-subunit alcohol dehydrogenase family)